MIDFFYSNSIFDDEMIVYIEEFDQEANTVLFDFYDSNEFFHFTDLINDTHEFKPSMVFLTGYTGKRIQENTLYRIENKVINEWTSNSLIERIDNSYIIGFKVNISESLQNIFNQSFSINKSNNFFNLFNSSDTYGAENKNLPSFKGKAQLVIRKVGQGNWNEVFFDGIPKMVFDAGGSIHSTKEQIRELIEKRIVSYRESNPILILSHWDKDHYHSLCGMNDEELKSFSRVIYREYAPNLTCRLLRRRLETNIPSEPMRPENKKVKKGVPKLVRKSEFNNQFVLYNSESHKDRNLSGILLTFKNASSHVIFTGDAHYSQISDNILIDLNYNSKQYLIVPHHGGKAGKFIYQHAKRSQPAIAILSVGKNHYNHPNKENIENLKLKRFKILRTDFESEDIVIDL